MIGGQNIGRGKPDNEEKGRSRAPKAKVKGVPGARPRGRKDEQPDVSQSGRRISVEFYKSQKTLADFVAPCCAYVFEKEHDSCQSGPGCQIDRLRTATWLTGWLKQMTRISAETSGRTSRERSSSPPWLSTLVGCQTTLSRRAWVK